MLPFNWFKIYHFFLSSISIWQDAVAEMGAIKAGELIRQYPIEVVSYVRGGFFPGLEQSQRQKVIDNNKKMLDEAAAIGAPLLVLVCGAEPRLPLTTSRLQIREGIEKTVFVEVGKYLSWIFAMI